MVHVQVVTFAIAAQMFGAAVEYHANSDTGSSLGPGTAYIIQTQAGAFVRPDEPNDECASLRPPPWCVFNVRPDGRLQDPNGRVMEDWSDTLKEFRESHPDSRGPVIIDPNGDRYRLQLQ